MKEVLFIMYLFSITPNTEAIVILLNRSKVKKLIEKLEKEPFTPNSERGGNVEEKLIKDCIAFTFLQAIVLWSSVFVTVGMVTIFTLRKRLMSSDYHDWEFTYGPITVLNVTYSPNYELTWAYQIIAAVAIGCNHCSVNLIMAGILAHASIQFKMLKNNLRRIIENAHWLMIKDNSDSSQVASDKFIDPSTIPFKYLKKALDDTVTYHLEILEIAREVKEIFSTLTLLIFLFRGESGKLRRLVNWTSSILSMTEMRFLKSFTDAVIGVFPTLLLCYWSQEVVYESEDVGRAAFEANFPGTDLRFQKMLTLIMHRSQNVVQLKAGKFIDICLPMFVNGK